MPIRNLELSDVGLFTRINFPFDRQINVFVGPNNCGKTTALFCIADIAVNPFTFPRKHIHKTSRFSVRLDDDSGDARVVEGSLPISFSKDGDWSGERAELIAKAQKQLGFTMFVPALRLGTDFRSKGPTVKTEKQTRSDLEMLMKTMEKGQEPFPEIESSYMRDEAIVQDLVNLDYQAYREDDVSIRKIIERIASLASRITEGFPVKFAGVREDNQGLAPYFETPDGRIPLNILSQGTQGLILWLARFIIGYAKYYEFPSDFSDKPAVLIIDEIDAHLHPSWQRRILPELVNEFPCLQIFCSTHSPLMIAGLKQGQIQLLTRQSDRKVHVTQNEADINGWTADEIYSCFLGVENPTDLRTDEALERLEALRLKKRLTSKERREMMTLRKKIGGNIRSSPCGEKVVDEMTQSLKGAIDEVVRKTSRVQKARKS